MSEPTITCPNCKSEIKLTESLAAPLIQAIRAQYEETLVHKESDVAKREALIREQQSAIARAKAGIEQRVADAKAELVRIPNRIFRGSSSGIMVSNNGAASNVAAESWSAAPTG